MFGWFIFIFFCWQLFSIVTVCYHLNFFYSLLHHHQTVVCIILITISQKIHILTSASSIHTVGPCTPIFTFYPHQSQPLLMALAQPAGFKSLSHWKPGQNITKGRYLWQVPAPTNWLPRSGETCVFQKLRSAGHQTCGFHRYTCVDPQVTQTHAQPYCIQVISMSQLLMV